MRTFGATWKQARIEGVHVVVEKPKKNCRRVNWTIGSETCVSDHSACRVLEEAITAACNRRCPNKYVPNANYCCSQCSDDNITSLDCVVPNLQGCASLFTKSLHVSGVVHRVCKMCVTNVSLPITCFNMTFFE